jgi:hypothetical protein
MIKKVYLAMNEWQRNTCIRFEPYSFFKHRYHKAKILIQNKGQ